MPRAVRRGGETAFDLDEGEDRRVRQCYEDGCVLFEAEEGRFHALAPLQADREIIGVVRITSLLEDNAAAREERAQAAGGGAAGVLEVPGAGAEDAGSLHARGAGRADGALDEAALPDAGEDADGGARAATASRCR